MNKRDLFKLAILRHAVPVKPPAALVLKVTNRCNFSCWACPRDTLTDAEKSLEMTYEDACRWVAQYAAVNKKGNAAITGLGEPTIWHPAENRGALYDLIEVIVDSGLTWELSTNGWLFKPHSLFDHEIQKGWVHFSIDRMHQAAHPFVEADSEHKSYHSHLLNILDECKAMGYRFTVRVHGEEADDAADFYELAAHVKRDSLMEFKPGKRWFVCPKMWRELVIEPDGRTISMCCVVPKPIDRTGLIGQWSEGWANDQRYRILADREPLCKTCPRYRRSPITWLTKTFYQRKIR